MDRKNFKIFHKSDNRGYSLLLTNKNVVESVIFESNIIARLNESDTNKIKPNYTKLVDCFACIGIFECAKKNNNRSKFLIVVTSADWITKLNETDIFKIGGVQFINMNNSNNNNSKNNTKVAEESSPEIVNVRKLLECGAFYFGKGSKGRAVDISVNIQNSHLGQSIDNRFIWNRNLIAPFVHFGLPDNEWYNAIICGSFLANTIYSSTGHIKICVVSRVSCQRVGTRFQTRGVDDLGNVANFIETEQCFINSDTGSSTSFIQIRGSVPLFWEQPGLQVGSHKIKFPRSLEMSSVAFENHFTAIKSIYNRIAIVNLLGSKEGERMLSKRYLNCFKSSSNRSEIPFVSFDYHREMTNKNSPNINKLKSDIEEFLEESHYCWIFNGEMVQRQYGVVRTNCVDCLDRTNAVQTMIGCQMILEKQLENMIPNQKSKLNSVLENFRSMWKTNGDNVSLIYAGSGALGAGSRLNDAQKAVKRTYQANFTDSFKQTAMLKLLKPNYLSKEDYFRARQFLPDHLLNIDERCLTDLVINNDRFCDRRPLKLFVGTWNVNGGRNLKSIAHKDQSVSDWLIDLTTASEDDNDHQSPDKPTDIFAIGFEEIVDLTASNIVSAKTTNQLQWAEFLSDIISQTAGYVLLSTIQLVGICLFVFVKIDHVPFISDLSTSSVKTGLKGTTGNKGAVGIRFQIYNSSLCFICSHFAAGQSNFKERNENYEDITKQLKFSRDRSIECHDFVFWCGDFNYRIDMANSNVKYLIANKNWEQLEQVDQLFNQRKMGNVFRGYNEGPTRFAPTYKYDIFCDDYDTSEKCRVPAWTDRVLWKVNMPCKNDVELCRQLIYNRAELTTSDHRPVAAIFEVNAIQINEKIREYVQEVIFNYGPRNGIVRIEVDGFPISSEIPNDLLDLIIGTFDEVGQIILVRFEDSDLLLNYTDGRCVIEAIRKFDKTVLKNTNYFMNVRFYEDDWKDQISKILNETKFIPDTNYPSLLIELLNNTQNRKSIISKEEFYNEDEDDIKVEGDNSHSRARSCSPHQKLENPQGFLNPSSLGEQANSCTNLVEKSVIEIVPKRPPPIRPPPINKSDVNINDSNLKKCPDESESVEKLVDTDYTSYNPDPNTNQNPMFFLPENNSDNLHPVLIPVKSSGDRPLPAIPSSTDNNNEILTRALNRPLPPIPPPPQKSQK